MTAPRQIFTCVAFGLFLQFQAEGDTQLYPVLALALKKKESWMKPWLSAERRLQYGQFDTLMHELRFEDVGSFKKYLRITPDTGMSAEILQRATHLRSPLPASLKLAMTLRYMHLATGDSYSSLTYMKYDFRTASETICHFIRGMHRRTAIADE